MGSRAQWVTLEIIVHFLTRLKFALSCFAHKQAGEEVQDVSSVDPWRRGRISLVQLRTTAGFWAPVFLHTSRVDGRNIWIRRTKLFFFWNYIRQKTHSAAKPVLQGKVTYETSQAFIYWVWTGLKGKIWLSRVKFKPKLAKKFARNKQKKPTFVSKPCLIKGLLINH